MTGAQVAQGDGAAISGKALGEMLQRLHQVWGCREGDHSHVVVNVITFSCQNVSHRITVSKRYHSLLLCLQDG